MVSLFVVVLFGVFADHVGVNYVFIKFTIFKKFDFGLYLLLKLMYFSPVE